MDKITKFSDAILLGSTFKEQCFGRTRLFQYNKPIATCAIGAGLDAVFGENWGNIEARSLKERFPDLYKDVLVCPVCSQQNYGAPTIVHLNDMHKWSRENIAHFLKKYNL